jgi:hypothetical protein
LTTVKKLFADNNLRSWTGRVVRSWVLRNGFGAVAGAAVTYAFTDQSRQVLDFVLGLVGVGGETIS